MGGARRRGVDGSRLGGLRVGGSLLGGSLGGAGIVRSRMVEKVGDDPAVHLALHGDRENVAKRRRKGRVELGMGQHGGTDDDLSAGVAFTVCALF